MATFAPALAHREPRIVRFVRRMVVVVACLYAVSFTWSMCRRLRQIIRIELRVPSPVLVAGATVGYDVITSGEVPNRIRLELVQGARREIVFEQQASMNRVRSFDPRVFRYTPTVTITPAMLARFEPGAGALRLTGFGGQKLLRTPVPRVRERPVELRP